MPISRLAKAFLVLAIVSGCALLLYLTDDGLGIAWPQNVVRNWEQFGLFNLHGKLVTNPGGFEATTNPEIYTGMSPVCLYPAYFAVKLFGWTGLGTMSFHILLALAVFWAIWTLLGRDNFAFVVAATAVLCPGYVRWQKILDPNVISVLFGLPFITIVVSILKKPRLGFLSVVGLFVLTFAFISLNWSTAWVLGPCALLLSSLPQINRRAVILFIALAGASSVLFVVGSIIAKIGGHHVAGAGTANLSALLRGYTWGNTGYGSGLTTGKALLRLAFVNGIGLLPLLVICGYAVMKGLRGRHQKTWLALSPFSLAMVEIGFMRNYFGHHPWMAAPLLLVGLIFLLVLLRVHNERDATTSGWDGKAVLVPALALLCFIYGLVVMIFFRANETNELSLVSLVRQHTERSTGIVIVKSLDPETARMAPRLDGEFDRRVMVADDLDHLPAGKAPIVILSTAPSSGVLNLLVQTSDGETNPQSWLRKTADWFNHSIARRRPGDRLELADAYFLYEPKP
jgi:hypothetical protein